MRSTWRGSIRFLLVNIPVKVYKAISATEAIEFNQLHKGCGGRTGRIVNCKKCNVTLDPKADIDRGFEYEKDRYVTVQDTDFERIKLDSTKAIDIQGFVEENEIPTAYFSDSYFVAPDGVAGEKPYALLRDAMINTGRIGIGRVVLRDREELVTVSPLDGGLLVQKLYFKHEVRAMSEVPGLVSAAKAETLPNELQLATGIVQQLATKFEDIDVVDHYHEAVRSMLTTKINGGETVAATEEAKTPGATVDIMTALKASLEQAQKSAPALKLVDGKGKAAKPKTAKARNKVAEAA